ncbi:dethiobiotin synthase [Nitrococcus mobilis]|uniref:ATP-dependent dethiobiotin synthetase BioD n=1 Tax=Nitrococcus mobilis Nb-231 TaxID=314278 RepID=A4BMA0_9GAMM|nr:dethiobiotin synthase [Nitrococcus mobilis]EAR23438.1 dethiobiotin synthase [Nitrococcus mobilis Nb-231]
MLGDRSGANIHLPKGLFVTGTDTGVGKTVVAAMLALGLRARYWKPIQSGLDEETDTQFVKRVTGLSDAYFAEERFRLTAPLSPHASAALDGLDIRVRDFALPAALPEGKIVVEGAGGLLVPLNSTQLLIDLIDHLGLPVILVTRTSLGTINHTLLSIEQLRQRSIPIVGVIMNGLENKINHEAIEHYGKVSVLGVVDRVDPIDSDALQAMFDKIFS